MQLKLDLAIQYKCSVQFMLDRSDFQKNINSFTVHEIIICTNIEMNGMIMNESSYYAVGEIRPCR